MNYISSYVRAVFCALRSCGTEELIASIRSIELFLNLSVSREVFSLLGNPIVEFHKKVSIVDLTSPVLNEKIRNFLLIIVANSRGAVLEIILRRFVSFSKQEIGMVDITIVSVEKLAKEKVDNIAKLLSKICPLADQVKNVIDQSLLGGVMVVIGSRVLDFSLKNRLSCLLSVSRAPVSCALENVNLKGCSL